MNFNDYYLIKVNINRYSKQEKLLEKLKLKLEYKEG